MLNRKRLVVSCFVPIILGLAPTIAIDFPYDIGAQNGISSDPGDVLKQENIDRQDSILISMLKLFWLEDSVSDGPNSAINFMIRIINIVLGLVSMIALVYLIYTFYRMFFVDFSSGISTVSKVLTGLLLAILIIGLSRFLVSYIFRARWLVKDGL